MESKLSINTKARLDSIAIKGECYCDDAPPREPTPPPPEKTLIDVVFLVDGSDSFDAKVEGGSDTKFNTAMKWCGDMISNELGSEWDGRATATVVQFSGIKQLESKYKPDSEGWADAAKTLRHYKIEQGPSVINAGMRSKIQSQLADLDTLDGNSQLFLCMQDLSNEHFTSKCNSALKKGRNQDRLKFLIIVTDEEWDIANLQPSRSLNASLSEEPEDSDIGKIHRRVSTSGSNLDRSARALVPALANKVYEDVFPVIVRPKSEAQDLDETTEFALNRLTGNKRDANFCDVRGGHMDEDMKKAMKKICDKMRNNAKF